MVSKFKFTNNTMCQQCPITSLLILFLILCGESVSATIYHVSKSGNDTNNGLSWSDAYLTLHKALQTVSAGDEIWVAEGTYYPDEGPGMTNDDRNASYSMVNGVGLFGGFIGTEVVKSERDWLTNLTILSGEIGNLSITTDNSYSIINNVNIDNSATLDGFIVEKSYSTIASKFSAIYNSNQTPIISNCTFRDNFSRSGPTNVSAGIFYSLCNNIILNNCHFLRNTVENSLGRGGAIHSINSTGSISQCYFENNSSVHSEGGAIYMHGSLKPIINDCEFSLNNANKGGAIYSLGGGNTIENCKIINNSADLGSAIFLSNVSTLNLAIKNCLIQNNSALGNGAVYIFRSSNVNFEECIFDNNIGLEGAGMYNNDSSPELLHCEFKNHINGQGCGMYNNNSSPILNECTFTSNIGSSGAGMYNFESIVSMTDCNLFNNVVQGQGGAIYNDNSTLTLNNCLFEENEAASSNGGAIFNLSTSISLSYSYFKNNKAGNDGGAFYTDLSSEKLVNLNYCNFEYNQAIGNGGAFYCEQGNEIYINNSIFRANESGLVGGGMFSRTALQNLFNCIFSGNYSNTKGGAYGRLGKGGASFYNCTIGGNASADIGGGILSEHAIQSHLLLQNCILWGNSSENIVPNHTNFIINNSTVPTSLLGNGIGNTDDDPLFVFQPDYNNAPTLDGDLHLTQCSPALDAGLDSDNNTTEDLDGLPRKFDAITGGQLIDRGAFERQENGGPTAICSSITAQLDANGIVTITADMIDGGSIGCSELSYLINGQSSINLNCSDIGSIQVTLTVTDINNATATCTSTITVEDNIAPIIFCPFNISHTNDAGLCSYLVTDSNHATGIDNCSSTTITYSPSFPHSFPVGLSHVIATATDASGNSSNCTFTITVSDLEAPTITCPAHITVTTESYTCSKVVNYSATASDNCPSHTTTYSINSGSTFERGTTTVVATVTDIVGLTASCAFTVTVIDNSAPNLICPTAIVYNLTSNECNKAITYSASGIDNCGVSSISYSPVSGSIFELGTSVVIVNAIDDNGNSSTCSFTVSITGDDDCDGAANACDVCPGGDDSIDNNNDGQPDCKKYPGFDYLPQSWVCNYNFKRVYLCHVANNKTLCVNSNAISAHLNHGDYLGICNQINCNNNNLKKSESNSEISYELFDNSEIEDLKVLVSPNPSTNEFFVDIDNHTGDAIHFRIYNNIGVLLNSFSENNEHSKLRFGNELVDGVYILQYGNENFSKSIRLVKVR